VRGTFGVVTRPGGARQLTWTGKPLYPFARDKTAGQATGERLKDA
jgi:predicted lipoprotein with Yx(FWY)xxD motif